MPDDQHGDRTAGEGSTEQATPEPRDALRWAPFTTPERLDEVGSTNAELLTRAAAGAPEGTVLLAERQSAGRGRLGRSWLDHPGGSVLCSILFRPVGPISSWFVATFVVALSAMDACSQVTGVECRCKWPNDLIAGDQHRKVAGVLAESAPGGALVVGIGINCNWPVEFPPAGSPDAAEIAARAISLDRIAGREVDRDAVAERMLEAVAQRWGDLARGDGRARLLTEYRHRSATIGELVRVHLPTEELTGRALDVDDEGRLLVDAGACIRIVDVGDVVHVRSDRPSSGD